jgi:hypothetical protein
VPSRHAISLFSFGSGNVSGTFDLVEVLFVARPPQASAWSGETKVYRGFLKSSVMVVTFYVGDPRRGRHEKPILGAASDNKMQSDAT